MTKIIQDLPAVLQHPILHLRLERRVQVDRQLHLGLLDIVHHHALVLIEVGLLLGRNVALLGVLEVSAIGPELVLDPVAPEVVVDEEEAFDAVDLIEEEGRLGLFELEHVLIGSLAGTVARAGLLGHLQQPLDLVPGQLDRLLRVGRDLSLLGVLEGDQRVRELLVHLLIDNYILEGF